MAAPPSPDKPQEPPGSGSSLQALSATVHAGFHNFFHATGKKIATEPRKWAVGTAFLAILFGSGFSQLETELRPEKLYTPQGSEGAVQKEWVEATFGFGSRPVSVTVVGETNVLTKEGVSTLFDLWDAMQLINATDEGQTYTHADLCARSPEKPADHQCIRQSVLAYWQYDRTLFEQDVQQDSDVLAKINSKNFADQQECCSYTPVVMKASAFGGTETDAAGNVLSAKALSLQVFLKQHRTAASEREQLQDTRCNAWEAAFTDVVVNWASTHTTSFKFYPQSERAYDESIEGTFASDSMLITVSYMFITAYASIVLAKNNNVLSDASLGPMCVLCTGLAVVGGFGLCLYAVPFSMVVNSVVFIMLGIGVDDAFVILAAIKKREREMLQTAWQSNSPDAEQEAIIEKIAGGLAVAGASISLTSATDFVSFLVGATTVIPALSAFCVYAAVTICFDFFMQCTLFVAFVTFNERRKARGQRDCCCCCGGVCCKCISSGGVHGSTYVPCGRVQVEAEKVSTQPPAAVSASASASASTSIDLESASPATSGRPTSNLAESESLVTRLIGRKLPDLILTKPGKAGVLVFTLVLLAVGGVGCTNLKMEFLYQWFLPGGFNCFELGIEGPRGCQAHIQTETMHVRTKYFTGFDFPIELYTKQVDGDGDYFTLRDELKTVVEKLEASPWIVNGSTNSWQAGFHQWRGVVAADTSASYHTDLAQYLATAGVKYADDVKLSADNSSITASRIHLMLKGQKTASAQIQSMDETRAIAASAAQLSGFTFTFPFLFWEGLKVVIDETLRNVGLAALMVFVICTIVLANVWAGFLILVNIIMIDVLLLGFMHWIGDYMNMVTAINLILAIGLCVDYSVHVCHTFLEAQGTHDERVRHALYHIGAPVFNGGLTTLIATLVLSVASSYVFQVFFRMFILIVVFGLYFGMVVLPVILSLVGPDPLPIDAPAAAAVIAGATAVEAEVGKQLPADESEKATEASSAAVVPINTKAV